MGRQPKSNPGHPDMSRCGISVNLKDFFWRSNLPQGATEQEGGQAGGRFTPNPQALRNGCGAELGLIGARGCAVTNSCAEALLL